MRLGQFHSASDAEPWAGIVHESGDVINIGAAAAQAGIDLPTQLVDILQEWEWETKLELVETYAVENDVGIEDPSSSVQTAPILSPEKVVACGLNYRDHAEEGGHDIPESPVLFAMFPRSLIGPDEDIEWNSSLTQKVDYEAELVVVIGSEAKEVDPDEAWDAIAGYTVGNDVSARDLQHGDGQWVRGKSLDRFAPIGPELVTRDEVDDPHSLEIWTEVNGERVQSSSTDELIFGVNELVSFCSQAFTLSPGDVLFTGTPPGVGVYREPPILLDDGDEVSVGIEELGVLRNSCKVN